MKKILAAGVLMLALAGVTGCTVPAANPARITGPATPVAVAPAPTAQPTAKPTVQATPSETPTPEAVAPPAAPVVVDPVVPAAPVIDWASDAWSVFQTGGFEPGVLEAAFKATYLGTWSNQTHFGTAPDVVVLPSVAHPGFFHFFTVSTGKVAKTTTCESKGMLTAEDHSCVSPSFYAGQANVGKDAPTITPPDAAKTTPSGPGGGMNQSYWEAVDMFVASTPQLTETQSRELFGTIYLGSSDNPNQYGPNTSALMSKKFPGTYHIFRIDPTLSAESPCVKTAEGQTVCMQ